MIEELRKFCGYNGIFCSHPLNFKTDSDDIDELLNQPILKCSSEACPFIMWLSAVNRYSEVKKGRGLKTEKARSYLLL